MLGGDAADDDDDNDDDDDDVQISSLSPSDWHMECVKGRKERVRGRDDVLDIADAPHAA
jgi:hypothetical protein